MLNLDFYPKISVIVPVHNIELYLNKCVTSIINQTYSNLEIILVNDGSTDSCPEICNYFASMDKRVRIFHKKNEGQSSARNLGISYASGDYISFVDGDDWIQNTMYEVLLKFALEKHADVVSCNFNKVTSEHTIENGISTGNQNMIKLSEFSKYLSVSPFATYVVWNKIYKKEVISETRFKSGMVYEEVHFINEIIKKNVCVVHLELPFYNYLVNRPGNTKSNFNPETKLKVITDFNEMINWLEKYSCEEEVLEYKFYVLGFYIELYLEACENRASKKTKNIIVSEFYNNYFFNRNIYSKLNMSLAKRYFIFALSPRLCSKMLIRKRHKNIR